MDSVTSDDKYVTKVVCKLKHFERLPQDELDVVQEIWELIKTTENFFDKVFLHILTNDSSLTTVFPDTDKLKDEEVLSSKCVRSGIQLTVEFLDAIIKNLNKPNLWILSVLKIYALNEFYKVDPEVFRDFQNKTFNVLKEQLEENGRELSLENEKVLIGVTDCLIEIMTQ